MFAAGKRGGWWVGRGLFAILFVAGGLNHFRTPDLYLRIMPPYLPEPRALVALSGLAEVVLGGLLLFRRTQIVAAWGLIALLVAIFPANFHMWQHAERFPIAPALLFLRLPLQGVLIAWAWIYTRRDQSVQEAPAPGVLVAVTLVSCLAGCGLGGPSLPRLDRGSLVKVESLQGGPVVVYFAASEETVPSGTLVKVVSDDEGITSQVDRKVIVGFGKGPHAGLAALIRRNDLQPDH